MLRLSLAVAGLRFAAAAAAAPPAELSDPTTCKQLGFPSTLGYQTPLALDSPYGVTTSVPIFMPMYASQPLDAIVNNASIKRVVIFLHGLSGDANTYFCTGMAAVAAAGLAPDSLVIAPWFGNEQVTGAYWSGERDGSVSAFWTVTRWLHGGNTSPGDLEPSVKWSTAFDILDALYAALAGARAAGRLPNLELVTFAGFSAGGQLASHWATMRHVGLAATSPQLRVIVGDPGSLLYLSDTRPAEQCRPLEDTGAGITCDSWVLPAERQGCPDYDTYKYGLSAGLDDNLYVAPLDGDAAALKELIADFPRRDIRWLFGLQDVCNCNTPGFNNPAHCVDPQATCTPNADGPEGCCDTAPDSTTSNALDVSCEAAVQGSNRLQRGLLFTQHVAQLFGAPPLAGTFAGGHDNAALYADAQFQAWAYSK